VNETHIRQALPFLKSAGVPYYLHAELKEAADDSAVNHLHHMKHDVTNLPI
jgi:hypothetical protein